MPMTQPTSFELSISARNDGTLEALYIRFKTGKVHRTEEIIEDVLIVDYDRQGELVGIEVLAPVKLSDLTRLVDRRMRQPFRRFVTRSAPDEFVLVN